MRQIDLLKKTNRGMSKISDGESTKTDEPEEPDFEHIDSGDGGSAGGSMYGYCGGYNWCEGE